MAILASVSDFVDCFYYPALKTATNDDAALVTLDGPEAHHAVHVLRMRSGQSLELFDGAGAWTTGVVREVGKRALTIEIGSIEHVPAAACRVILATAIPKGDRFDWLVEKTTELGVDELIPLVTERSVVEPRATKLDRLRASVVAACKQSRRRHLLEIREPISFAEFLNGPRANQQAILADPHGTPWAPSLDGSPESSMLCMVGPEGGFSPAEVESACQAGFLLRTFGSSVLRVETAGVAYAAIAGLERIRRTPVTV